MISRIFTEKFISNTDEDLFHIIQQKKIKWFALFFIAVGMVLIPLSFKQAFEIDQFYRAGFYILIYLGVFGFCGLFFLIRKALKNNSSQKSQEKEIKLLKKELAQAKKIEALGILAGNVAHDLNNILSGMATYPEVLMMDESLDPKLRQGLNIIRDSGQKASAVVRDLLTISQGGASAQMQILNMNGVIDRYINARDFEKIRKKYSRVELEIISEPELLNIKGSYLHIEKSIINLLFNAMEEVSQKDKGRVIIQTANCYVDPSILEYKEIVTDITPDVTPGEYVVLSVIDNGSGFDKKHIKKIFDPFFIKKQMGKSGTGLGLTVVWNAVQDHGGFINLVSDEKGTRFDLLFPATRKERV